MFMRFNKHKIKTMQQHELTFIQMKKKKNLTSHLNLEKK
jgi:hypothetical protein